MTLIKLIRNHLSLLLIITGAGGLFVSNILLKGFFTERQYGEYSIFVTFIQLITSFGLLGLEQVFLRLSEPKKKNRIVVNTNFFQLIILVGVVMSLILSLFFSKFFLSIEMPFLLIFGATFSIVIIMFYFNVFRLLSKFIISQFINNLWKYILLIVCLCFFIFKINSITELIYIICLTNISLALLFTIYLYRNVTFDFRYLTNNKTIFLYSFHFFLSMATLTFIGFFDKFFVKATFGPEVFGNYFYLATIFYFPFSLLQGYIGFKELVFFKQYASESILKKKLLQINLLSLLAGVLIIFCAYLCNYFSIITKIDFDKDLYIIVMFMMLGLIRMNYSLLSALLGAIGTIKNIRNANIQSLLLIIVLTIGTYKYLNSINAVVFFILGIWISRIIVWYFNAIKQLKIVPNDI